MAQLPLTPEQHRRLVRLIAARANIFTPLQRQNLLGSAGLSQFVTRLNFDVDARTFSQQLVRVLQEHGTLAATGQPALVSLLREVREIVAGHEDEAAFVDSLLALSPQTHSTPRPAPPTPPLLAAPPGTVQRPDLDAQAGRNARRKLWGFLVLLGVAWLGIVVGIALFGWDVMEPVTFVVGGTLTLGGYAYFALTLQELSPAAFYTRLVEQERRGLYARQGLEPEDASAQHAIARSSEPPAVHRETPPQVTTPPPVSQRALEEAYLDLRCRDEVAQDFAPLDAHVSQAGTGQVQRRPHRVEMRPLFRHRPELKRLQEVAEEKLAPPERETREYTDIIRAIEELRRVVLLGEPGAGKTTTLRKLEMDRIERARRDPAAPIPLFVPLGRWTRPEQSLPAFTAAQMGALGDFLDSLLAQQRAVLLLDGLDQIPPAHREAKARQGKALFKDHPALISVVSCREQDYTLDLGFDRLVIVPLDPARIREFAHNYLGQEEGERFFWRLAGGDQVREVWRAWERAGATWEQFWHAPDIPRENPDVYRETTGAQDAIWREKVRNPASLMRLAGNPYMLLMLVAVYQRSRGELPANRGRLFAEFVATLLEREKLAMRDEVSPEVALSPEAEALLAALARLAYEMQVRRAQETGEGSAVTVLPRAEVVPALLSERQLYLGGSTNILSTGDEVRFSHQLLQEYFAATFMQREIEAGRLQAGAIWPRERWWERTNWEEATVLLAGLHSDDCTPVLEWVADANPEVAAGCIARSGAETPPPTLARLRERWRPRLTDPQHEPDPRGRAAVGRALAVAGLDDRRGWACGRTGCRRSCGSSWQGAASPSAATRRPTTACRRGRWSWRPCGWRNTRSPIASSRPSWRPRTATASASGGRGWRGQSGSRSNRTFPTGTTRGRGSTGTRRWPSAAG
ncbi:MAG: NACHT domain-containing protein [Ardenticatenaceae bacterium]|nr:NACHT domain-containing protein [Ardenticatenaceae bacterium]